MPPVYRLREVVKTHAAEGAVFRLRVPRLEIAAGERVALLGRSGSGKSTLLDLLALVLRPSETGVFELAPAPGGSEDVAGLWRRGDLNRLAGLRKRTIGYVLQTGGLLPFLTVRDNIGLSRRLLRLPEDDTVESLTEALGISRQLGKLPGLLSAGERQRVAIARALAHRPSIVIADEPTASLDPITGQKIMALFMDLVERLGVTLIVASHDWDQIHALGLRRLAHSSRPVPGGPVVESVFSG